MLKKIFFAGAMVACMVCVAAPKKDKKTKDTPAQTAQVSDSRSGEDFKLGKNSEILWNMFREISFFYVDSVNTDKLVNDAGRGMTMRLDPYTQFMPEQEMDDFEIMTTGKYGGIGSLIRQKGDYVLIAQPYKGSPADKAGLKIGDKILEINGQDMKGASTTKISSLLKGDPGTEVKIKIERIVDGKAVELNIKRERIAIPGVPYHGWASEGVGYIDLSDFTEDCASDLRKAFMELKNTGNLKSVIIDVRSNGGGILQEAVKIVSMFVPRGTEVVSTKGRNTEASFKTEQDPVDLEIPIVVLTNSGSASASEILAGSIQDLDRGVLIGQRTFGKGLVQVPRPLGYNAYLKITTAKYYIPSGRCIQAIDYTHRNEDGSVAFVPDSLIGEFKTRNGRTVYDGGGVSPDIKLDPRYVSRFAMIAYSKGYLDDFADEYCRKHALNESFDLRTFRLTDADYADFVKFMADKDVDYESESKAVLADLRNKAERERYIDAIRDQLDQIEKKLTEDKNENLQLHKAEMMELLEEEIVLRRSYSQGVSERRLINDADVKAAVELLNNPQEYKRIITEQNLPKK